MRTAQQPLERLSFDTQTLVDVHAPIWRHPNKRIISAIACPRDAVHGGRLEYSRWPAIELPTSAAPSAVARVIGVGGLYDYASAHPSPEAMEWHVHFAGWDLFSDYGSDRFAQDQIQIAEHPALAAVREALVDGDLPRTGCFGPTSVLLMGVERRCRIDPTRIYGSGFARASAETIVRATKVIDPPTITNLIAMGALRGGGGTYSRFEIEWMLVTAYTGFNAAMLESERVRAAPCPVVVHTGHWRSAGSHGSRVLMAALQVLAARMAGIDRLVFHTGAPADNEPLGSALKCVAEWGHAAGSELIDRILDHEFHRGDSDDLSPPWA